MPIATFRWWIRNLNALGPLLRSLRIAQTALLSRPKGSAHESLNLAEVALQLLVLLL